MNIPTTLCSLCGASAVASYYYERLGPFVLPASFAGENLVGLFFVK
jgi:hypothetical protein